MKVFTMIFLSFFLSKSCDTQLNNEMKNTSIEYQALSRGYFLNIIIQDEKLSIIDKRDGKPRDYNMTKKDWKEITEETFKVVFKDSPLKRAKFKGLKRNIDFLH